MLPLQQHSAVNALARAQSPAKETACPVPALPRTGNITLSTDIPKITVFHVLEKSGRKCLTFAELPKPGEEMISIKPQVVTAAFSSLGANKLLILTHDGWDLPHWTCQSVFW